MEGGRERGRKEERKEGREEGREEGEKIINLGLCFQDRWALQRNWENE